MDRIKEAFDMVKKDIFEIKESIGYQKKEIGIKKKNDRKVVYIIGSLKNWKVIELAKRLRKEFPEWEIFDSWISPGPEADDFWRKYSKLKGQTYTQALKDWSATHIFEFDRTHLDRSSIVILYMPCGKSGHLELGYGLGQGKKGFVLFDKEPERWDVMYQFADGVFFSYDELKKELIKLK